MSDTQYLKEANTQQHLDSLQASNKLLVAEVNLLTRLLCETAINAQKNGLTLSPEVGGWLLKKTDPQQAKIAQEAKLIAAKNAQEKQNQLALNQFRSRNAGTFKVNMPA